MLYCNTNQVLQWTRSSTGHLQGFIYGTNQGAAGRFRGWFHRKRMICACISRSKLQIGLQLIGCFHIVATSKSIRHQTGFCLLSSGRTGLSLSDEMPWRGKRWCTESTWSWCTHAARAIWLIALGFHANWRVRRLLVQKRADIRFNNRDLADTEMNKNLNSCLFLGDLQQSVRQHFEQLRALHRLYQILVWIPGLSAQCDRRRQVRLHSCSQPVPTRAECWQPVSRLFVELVQDGPQRSSIRFVCMLDH